MEGVRDDRAAVTAEDGPRGRRCPGLVIAVGGAFLVQRDSGATPVRPECNGSARLCALRLDDVALATTHNSMNDAEDGFVYPHPRAGTSPAGERRRGPRRRPGPPRMAGDQPIVYSDLTDRRHARLVKAAGDVPAQHALALRAEAGPPAPATTPRRLPLPPVRRARRGACSATWATCRDRFLEADPDEVLHRHPGRARRAEELTPCSRTAVSTRTLRRSTRPFRCPPSAPDGGLGASGRDRSRERHWVPTPTRTVAASSRRCRTNTARWRR